MDGKTAAAATVILLPAGTASGTAPASGTVCNGAYNGTFNGDITISAGQSCVFVYGGATGNATENGGSLTLMSATVGGNVQVQGGGFNINMANIGGNLQVQNLPPNSTQNQICGTTVKGDLQYQNCAAGVQIDGASCAGNTIGGNLQVQNNTAATLLIGNNVHGDLQDNNNTAATQVTGNTVGNNLQCQNNTTITGGKHGQAEARPLRGVLASSDRNIFAIGRVRGVGSMQ